MTFLNGLLAFGAAAFTVPLLIHLLHRSRFQVVEWGAMHLLQSSQNVNSKRVQWQQLLLLLLRCMIPILLALAMSRPLFQSWTASNTPSPLSVAIVLDDSMSMFASASATQPLTGASLSSSNVDLQTVNQFQMTCDAIEELLMKLPPGSDAIIVLAGGHYDSLPSHVPSELVKQLKEIRNRKHPAGKFELDPAFRHALEWLNTSSNSRRQIVVASDFQASDWDLRKESSYSELRRIADEQPVAPEFALLRIGNSATTKPNPANLALSSIAISPSMVAFEQSVSIATTIQNDSDEACDAVQVSILVNELEVDRQEIKIASHATSQLRSVWKANRLGPNIVRAQILRADALEADNSKSAVIVVHKPLSILLVDGDRRGEAMQSETDFLRLALSPFSLLQGEKGDLFVSKTIQPHELNEQMLTGFRSVVLCNVPELSEPQQGWIRDFVKRGNGLVVFLGDRIRPDQYQTWPSVANNGLRIANYSARVKTTMPPPASGDVPATATEDSPSTRIDIQHLDFIPVHELSSMSLNAMGKTRFEYRVPMALDNAATVAPFNASVAMSFEDHQPWILQNSLGDGNCVWVSTACDDDDSNFPSRPAFVPFVQKIVAYASNARPTALSLAPGNEWVFSAVDSSTNKGLPETDVKITVTKPDGTNDFLDAKTSEKVRFSRTRELGVYLAKSLPLQTNGTKEGTNATAAKPSLELLSATVVQLEGASALESNLQRLDSSELKQLAGWWKSPVHDTAQSLLDGGGTGLGREVWTWLWTSLVICFLAEIALEQWLSPRLRIHRTTSMSLENKVAA